MVTDERATDRACETARSIRYLKRGMNKIASFRAYRHAETEVGYERNEYRNYDEQRESLSCAITTTIIIIIIIMIIIIIIISLIKYYFSRRICCESN